MESKLWFSPEFTASQIINLPQLGDLTAIEALAAIEAWQPKLAEVRKFPRVSTQMIESWCGYCAGQGCVWCGGKQ